MKTHCRNCGEVLPPPHAGRGKQKTFCSDNCRVKFAYRRDHPRKATNAERRASRESGGVVPPVHLRRSSKIWLAAFWDSEGYIGLSKRQKRPGEQFYYCPMVQVYNTNHPMMAYASGLLNVIPHNVEERPNGNGNKPILKLKIARSAMRRFLLQLKPHLVIKARQAEIVAKFCQISDRSYVRSYPVEKYEAMWQEMAALNKRGA